MKVSSLRISYTTLCLLGAFASAQLAGAQAPAKPSRPLPNPGFSAPLYAQAGPGQTAPVQTAPVQTPQTQVGGDTGTVSIKADGTDVRGALKSLFAQAKKNYVIEPGVYFALYVSLDGVEFDEALGIICHLAKLKTDVRDGIYYVSPDHSPQTATTTPTQSPQTPKPTVATMVAPTPKALPLTEKVLRTRRVTIHFTKTNIRYLFAELSKQSNVPISLDKSVPYYKLDVILRRASLYYALNRITKAAGLSFAIQNGGVVISNKIAAKPVAKKLASNP